MVTVANAFILEKDAPPAEAPPMVCTQREGEREWEGETLLANKTVVPPAILVRPPSVCDRKKEQTAPTVSTLKERQWPAKKWKLFSEIRPLAVLFLTSSV